MDLLDGAHVGSMPGPAADERDVIARLFGAMVRDGQTRDVAPLHDAVRTLVARMRGRGAPPELVIIALKDTLEGVPGVRGSSLPVARELAAGAVRLCIAEYYSSEIQRAD